MRLPGAIAALVGLSSLAPMLVSAQGETKIHEKGRCAIRGHCGKQSIFGGELPCPDNDLAQQPEDSVRQKLVNLCGSRWSEGPVCCRNEQVRNFPTLGVYSAATFALYILFHANDHCTDRCARE
jgi:Niemann-Pick C1 protein